MRLTPAAAFEALWRELGGPDLVAEYRFAPPRRYRADYAHLGSRTLVEVEGGTWVRGRHSRPQGYASDCQKYNLATRLGWRVFRLTTDMVTPEHIEPIIESIRETA